jgi:glycosyltransferase involved in cell wall biosynthesis
VKVICLEQQDLLGNPRRGRAAVRGIWNPVARRAMAQVLDQLPSKSAIVHVHLWYKALSSSVVREAIQRRLPVVLSLHDYTAACPNGTFYDFQRQAICPLRPMSGACIRCHCDARSRAQKVWRVARNFVQAQAGLLPKGITHFVSVSGFSSSILREHLPAHIPVTVIPNPIEVPHVEPARVESSSAFVCVGRLAAQKGPELFAEAAREAGVPAIFVGNGELQDEVLRRNPGAIVTGWLDRAGTLARVGQARALVLPSRWYETQGMVVAEAAALGVPAIVPDTSAARDMVVDQETGIWFRGGDQDSLVEKIRQLQPPEIAARMGRAAYDRYWRNPMTLDRHLSELESLYAKLSPR